MSIVGSKKYETAEVAHDEVVDLNEQLDRLWTRYLTLLDEYCSAQGRMKQVMSTGFMSLAQANFSSPRTRFGRDYYDQRAVATTRVNVESRDDDHARFKVSFTEQPTKRNDSSVDPEKPLDHSREIVSQSKDEIADEIKPNKTYLPSPSPTPEPEAEGQGDDARSEGDFQSNETISKDPIAKENDSDASDKSVTTSIDPLRWFGILIPPPLRSAQESFKYLFKDDQILLQAVNSARAMREVEVEIRRVRKAIRKLERSNAPKPTVSA